MEEFGLQDRLPRLYFVEDLRLGFLPPSHFDVIHAHSVFSHTPLEVLDECLEHVGRIMKPTGFFDFTWKEGDGAFLGEDFYHPRAAILGLAQSRGFDVEEMADWHYDQPKVRLRRQDAK